MWAFPAWYGSTPSWATVPSITLAAFGIYQLNRLFDVVEDEINDPGAYERIAAAKTAMRSAAILAICASLLLSAVLVSLRATVVLSIVLLLGILYSVPTLRRAHGKPRRLKQIGSLNNAIPSLAWPLATILYPAIPHSDLRLLPLLLAMTCLSCIVFTIEVAWDIRDLRGDVTAEVRTLATTLGVHRALLVPFMVSSVQASVLVLLVSYGVLSALWLLPAGLVVLLPGVAFLWRDALAANRDLSHVLVFMNVLALLPIYVVGRWVV